MAISLKDKDVNIYLDSNKEDGINIPQKRISSLGTAFTFLRRGT